eukprot:scaffold169950_cov34-Tisochrysis_lutea.AAC.2
MPLTHSWQRDVPPSATKMRTSPEAWPSPLPFASPPQAPRTSTSPTPLRPVLGRDELRGA